jgi:alpha-glucosidase
MLVLYRNALALRQFVRGDAELTWLDDAGDEVLAFRRGEGFACLVNFGDAPVSLPDGAEVLLSSDPSYVAGAPLTVDTAVWVRL